MRCGRTHPARGKSPGDDVVSARRRNHESVRAGSAVQDVVTRTSVEHIVPRSGAKPVAAGHFPRPRLSAVVDHCLGDEPVVAF